MREQIEKVIKQRDKHKRTAKGAASLVYSGRCQKGKPWDKMALLTAENYMILRKS